MLLLHLLVSTRSLMVVTSSSFIGTPIMSSLGVVLSPEYMLTVFNRNSCCMKCLTLIEIHHTIQFLIIYFPMKHAMLKH